MDNVLLILFGAVIGFIVTKGVLMSINPKEKSKKSTGGGVSYPIKENDPVRNEPIGPTELKQQE